MNNIFPTNENEETPLSPVNNGPNQMDEKVIPDEGELAGESEENTGMDMGTEFKVDREQDLDDLVHSRGTLNKDEIPPPEEA